MNKDYLQNRSIMVQSDNRTTLAYIRKQGGTRSLILLNLVKELWLILDPYNIRLTPFFLPGSYNSWARGLPLPDWHLDSEILERVFCKWGTPEVDLFATSKSKVVPKYATIEASDQGAWFVNAFSRPWRLGFAWIFPPPPLIPKVLQHLNSASGIFLLVVPRWERTFWRGDLRSRALDAPYQLLNLERHLVDMSTGLPPQDVRNLFSEVWRVRGGARG